MEGKPPQELVSKLASTNWTLLGKGDVEHLVRSYWKPVHRFLRARLRDSSSAEDFTQEFFLRMIERDVLARLDPNKGRFRSFLFHLAEQFLIDRYRERKALRRGGGVANVGLEVVGDLAAPDLDPRGEFDRQWFLSLLNRARTALKEHYLARKRPEVYQTFRLFYFGSDEPGRWSHKRIADDLGLTPTQVNNFIHRARGVYAGLVRELVSEYATTPEEVEEELKAIATFLDRHQMEENRGGTTLLLELPSPGQEAPDDDDPV